MMAKPMKSLELHYPMIQFLIMIIILLILASLLEMHCTVGMILTVTVFFMSTLVHNIVLM